MSCRPAQSTLVPVDSPTWHRFDDRKFRSCTNIHKILGNEDLYFLNSSNFVISPSYSPPPYIVAYRRITLYTHVVDKRNKQTQVTISLWEILFDICQFATHGYFMNLNLFVLH